MARKEIEFGYVLVISVVILFVFFILHEIRINRLTKTVNNQTTAVETLTTTNDNLIDMNNNFLRRLDDQHMVDKTTHSIVEHHRKILEWAFIGANLDEEKKKGKKKGE